MVYAFNENFVLPISHDEVVHGKGSMLQKMPGDEWQQAANLRCYAAFMFGHPGKKLNFMGNELGQTLEWNHDAQLQWDLLKYEKHAGIQSLYRDLNRLYRDVPALHVFDCDSQGFEWIDHENADQSILSFVRKGRNQQGKVYAVCNFTPLPRENFRLGVKDEGYYKLLLNTDDKAYWGSEFPVLQDMTAEKLAWNHQSHSITINIPPLATLFIIAE